jgi:molybdate transport system substrate-binding protein
MLGAVLLSGARAVAQEPLAADVAERGAVRVAVAANLASLHEKLAEAFTAGTGHTVTASIGSTGQLYAQIMNGAQYDVFLSADAKRVDLLHEAGAAVEGTRFTYAIGRLALYGPSLDSLRAIDAELRDAANRRIAIANPRLAPYGAAAEQLIERLGLRSLIARRLVRGENVTQAFQFVKTGAAEIGFVAWSQVVAEPERSWRLVPAELHDRIAQDAVLLYSGETNPAARAYLEFLRGDVARRMIRAGGYDTP